MSRKTLHPVRRWILKSIPLDLLIAEWLKVRELSWIGEDRFPAQLREQADAEAFLLREGGDLLGDRRRLHLGLVCADGRTVTRSERLHLLEDLREYLRGCGRQESEFEFLRPTRFRLGRLKTTPLFFILWSPDAPLLERLLSGKADLPAQIKQDRYTFRELFQEQRESPEPRPEAQPKSEDAELPFGRNSINYRVVGTSRGEVFRKMFIRLAGDRLFLVYISSDGRLRSEYVTALIDGLASSTYPVYRLEDLLLNHPPSEVRVTVLEARRDGNMEMLSYGHEHVFLRDGDLHTVRAQAGRNLHIQRWQMKTGDRLLMLPAPLTSAEKREIQEMARQETQEQPAADTTTAPASDGASALEGFLNSKGIGRTLELFWPRST